MPRTGGAVVGITRNIRKWEPPITWPYVISAIGLDRGYRPNQDIAMLFFKACDRQLRRASDKTIFTSGFSCQSHSDGVLVVCNQII